MMNEIYIIWNYTVHSVNVFVLNKWCRLKFFLHLNVLFKLRETCMHFLHFFIGNEFQRLFKNGKSKFPAKFHVCSLVRRRYCSRIFVSDTHTFVWCFFFIFNFFFIFFFINKLCVLCIRFSTYLKEKKLCMPSNYGPNNKAPPAIVLSKHLFPLHDSLSHSKHERKRYAQFLSFFFVCALDRIRTK